MAKAKQPKSLLDRLPGRTGIWNLLSFPLAALVLWFVWPELLHLIVFKWIILKWWVTIPILILAGLAYARWRDHDESNRTASRTAVLSLAVFTVAVLFMLGMNLVISYGTYNQFAQFEQREARIVTDPGFTRYTPRRIAFRGMHDAVQQTEKQVLAKYSVPFITTEGYGYVSPLVPDGVANIFSLTNSGQMVFNDRVDATRKVRPVSQPVLIGPGMQWLDDIDRHLVKTDFFATYDNPHLAQLDPTTPDRLTSIVPKTKYHFFLFPYWAGVVLVHDDGTIEDISAEMAKEDKRLQGQWLFPMSLARYYVEIQNNGSDWGPFGMYFQRPGNIAIVDFPEIEADSESVAGEMETNQFPFLLRSTDEKLYQQVPTKPEGGGLGMNNMFYVDATSGALTKFSYANEQMIHFGPDAILARVKNWEGWNWRRKGGTEISGGTFEAVEPVQIVRPSEPDREYWKATITTTSFTDVAATVVIPADDPVVEQMLVFKTQQDFDTWNRGGTVTFDESPNTILQQIGAMEDALSDLQSKLDALRKTAEEEAASESN